MESYPRKPWEKSHDNGKCKDDDHFNSETDGNGNHIVVGERFLNVMIMMNVMITLTTMIVTMMAMITTLRCVKGAQTVTARSRATAMVV